MSRKLLYLLSLLLVLSSTPQAQAGFWVKKHTTIAAPASSATAGMPTSMMQQVKAVIEMQKSQSAMPSFNGYRLMGWLAILSVICGFAGFFAPFFSIPAVLFGLFGLSRYNRKKGLAVAGLVLGLIVIGLVIFTDFVGFAFF